MSQQFFPMPAPTISLTLQEYSVACSRIGYLEGVLTGLIYGDPTGQRAQQALQTYVEKYNLHHECGGWRVSPPTDSPPETDRVPVPGQ